MGGSEIYKSTIAALLCLSAISPALAEAPSPQTQAVQLTAQQLFAFADAARDRGDFATADAAYRALATNPSIDLRSEARFRLALMLAYRQHKLADAGVVLRQILDEQAKAARVRLELARIDALLGHMGAADRELRAAEAAGLPPAVEQQVQFYAQALDAKRPVGGSLSVSLAPDSNINHATSSNTLNTIIGQFQLNNQAQAQSGVGLASQAQGFVRQAYSSTVSLLAQLSGSANIYRQSTFDDLILAPQIGPEINLGRDRLSVALGPAWRWYGNVPYTFSLAASGDWQHRLTTREQLRVNASFAHVDNRLNALQTGDAYALSAGFDRAISARFGLGAQLSGNRQSAQDPGYATAAGAISLYGWREFGKTTVSANLSYTHLEADARLSLFPARRIDNDFASSLAITLRQLRVGTISPVLRLRYEKSASTVELYDYHRLSGELGIATAF